MNKVKMFYGKMSEIELKMEVFLTEMNAEPICTSLCASEIMYGVARDYVLVLVYKINL